MPASDGVIRDNYPEMSEEEFDSLDEVQQYYLWIMGKVPVTWYRGDSRAESVHTAVRTAPKREPVIWRPGNYQTNNHYRSPYDYVPVDRCHQTLERVENAIREVNQSLQQTPRLITTEEVK